MAGAFFTAGHTCADEEQTFGFQIRCAADAIVVVRVAAVNDDVTWFK